MTIKTVSFRIQGSAKIVHVSATPPRAGQTDVASSALLRRVQGDLAAMQSLRSLIVSECSYLRQGMAAAQVVEEVIKRVETGRWSLVVVDVPKIATTGSQGGGNPGGGAGGSGGGSGSGSQNARTETVSNNEALKDSKKTWVEFELLDKNKRPVKGLSVEVTLPDGSVEVAALSDKGSFRKDGIDPGTCRVRFPDLCGREWAKASCFAEGTPVSLFAGKVKLSPGPHKVIQGDHIASIAADAGYLSWKTIWDDGKNAALKTKRNPNVLYPGDILEIPVKQNKQESIPTTEYTTFQTIGDPVQLKIVVLDWAGNPVVDTELDIQLDGGEKIKTAGDGSATKKGVDPQGNKEGKLVVKGYSLALKVGHLDPVEEITGQVWRLNNLGYRAGTATEPDDVIFRSAVEEFQCDYALAVDGICGPNTQGKLKDTHGS